MAPLLLVFVAADLFELTGRIVPPARASVSIHRVQSPFATNTLAEGDGRFTFKKLEAGAYTIAVFMPSRGEARQTVEVGPGTADARRRVSVTLELDDSQFTMREVLTRRHAVSTKQLAVPAKAVAEYEAAQRLLAKNDVAGATRRLERAVELAPQFAPAWNHLGTIAYQTKQYERAAECFRESLAADPELYEPLVNLGGVLLNLHKPAEAYQYNLHAVLTRPNDALANSQFGMSYWHLGNLDMAEKYLRRAVEIDPAHFSHPQLLLADIQLKRGNSSAAAEELESFLNRHPDWPQAAAMRGRIAEWKKQSTPPAETTRSK
jgi:tetratricopeptide (TPR) repeat protein